MRSFSRMIAIAVGVLALCALSRPASADVVDPATLMADGITGPTQFSTWNNLSSTFIEAQLVLDFPSHPGSGAWPGDVPNQLGAANSAVLTKVANGPAIVGPPNFPPKAPYFAGTAGPFAGTTSAGRMHYAGFTNNPNTNAGTLGVGTTTPLANLTNVVFQIEITDNEGYSFFNNVLPTLNYNGAAQALPATYSKLVETTVGPIFQDAPASIHTWAVQWDLSALGPITDFQVQFTGVEHNDIYVMRLDQYQNFSAIPEPSTVALGATGLVMLAGFAFRRRRRAA
jgi:hypothetical protein